MKLVLKIVIVDEKISRRRRSSLRESSLNSLKVSRLLSTENTWRISGIPTIIVFVFDCCIQFDHSFFFYDPFSAISATVFLNASLCLLSFFMQSLGHRYFYLELNVYLTIFGAKIPHFLRYSADLRAKMCLKYYSQKQRIEMKPGVPSEVNF